MYSRKSKLHSKILFASALALALSNMSCRDLFGKKDGSGSSNANSFEEQDQQQQDITAMMFERLELSVPAKTATDGSDPAAKEKAEAAIAAMKASADQLFVTPLLPMIEGLVSDASLQAATPMQVANVLENIASAMNYLAENEKREDVRAVLYGDDKAKTSIEEASAAYAKVAGETVINGSSSTGSGAGDSSLETEIADATQKLSDSAKEALINSQNSGGGSGAKENPLTAAITSASGEATGGSTPGDESAEESAEDEIGDDLDEDLASEDNEYDSDASSATSSNNASTEQGNDLGNTDDGAAAAEAKGTLVKNDKKNDGKSSGSTNAAVVANAVGSVKKVANGGSATYSSSEADDAADGAAKAILAAGKGARSAVAEMMLNLSRYVDQHGSQDGGVRKEEMKQTVKKGRKAARQLRLLRAEIRSKISDPAERKKALKAVWVIAQNLRKVDSPDEAEKVADILAIATAAVKNGDGSLQSVLKSLATAKEASAQIAAPSNIGGDGGAGGSGSGGPLAGVYLGLCAGTYQNRVTFSDSTYVSEWLIYANSGCSGDAFVGARSTFDSTLTPTANANLFHIDFKMTNYEVSPTSSGEAAQWNTANIAGFSNWQEKQMKSVFRK